MGCPGLEVGSLFSTLRLELIMVFVCTGGLLSINEQYGHAYVQSGLIVREISSPTYRSLPPYRSVTSHKPNAVSC